MNGHTEDRQRPGNDVLLVSLSPNLEPPFLEGMRAAREGLCEREDAEELLWQLDTRYYTADLHLARIRHDTETNIAAQVQAKLPHNACDALVLLCDGTEAGTCTKLHAWKAIIEDLSPSVQLCVATTSDHSAALPEEAPPTPIEEWCVENGIELVLWNPQAENPGSASGGLLHEAQGLHRVIEALEANMWPIMKMKPRGGVPRPSIQHDEAPTQTNHACARPETERKESESAPKVQANPSSNKPEKLAEDDEEQEWTEDFEAHFEKAFQQLAGLRDVRQKSAQMSDQERREMAAETAMALARAFGINLDSDSESD